MKQLIKSTLRRMGYHVERINVPPAGSKYRGIGDFPTFLEDIGARGFAPAFVLDVGGNLGDWTRMALRVFPKARFLLIEPQIETRDSLNALCAEFPNVAWVLAGAGATKGELALSVGGHIGASSFLPAADEGLAQVGRQRRVDIITIDELLASRQSGIPDLVKMDIQGFEIEAMKGGHTLFGRTELFILEVSLYEFMDRMPILSEIVAFMHERGYELYDIPGYFRRPLDGALAQLDFAFARRGGFLRKSSKWD
jgi:FkbM family methyltransferase